MVSTGSGLVEIAPDEVATLSREEIQLRDGRVIRGTLVGGQLKARTALGEIAVKVDELQSYRAGAQVAAPGPAPPRRPPLAGPREPDLARAGDSPAPASAPTGEFSAGCRRWRPTRTTRRRSAGHGTSSPAGPDARVARPRRPAGCLEVRRRERAVPGRAVQLLAGRPRGGRGQQVRYVDSIDRRLRILNLLVFDGGHWVKVRLADGTEGWVPAETVREVR